MKKPSSSSQLFSVIFGKKFFSLSSWRPMTRVATPKLILTIFDDHHPSCITSLTNPFLQEQLKFIYDTLEEFVLCGYTFFPVKDISQNLKLKSTRKPGCKTNQYEKEYSVIFQMSFSKCTSELLFTRTLN